MLLKNCVFLIKADIFYQNSVREYAQTSKEPVYLIWCEYVPRNLRICAFSESRDCVTRVRNDKRLASCLATKWDQSYSPTMSWLRCGLTFSLLRCAIQCPLQLWTCGQVSDTTNWLELFHLNPFFLIFCLFCLLCPTHSICLYMYFNYSVFSL